MRPTCTTSWSPLPPRTREVQFDEKWAFVAKKEKHCDPDEPADARKGDCWDHVALDPEHRLVVAVIPGKRTAGNAEALVAEFHRRTAGRPMSLITTDEYAPYREAILRAYGAAVTPPRTGKRGRPRKPHRVAPASLLYATVHKARRKGRVVKVEPRLVFGTEAALKAALGRSASSRAVNTSFVERQDGSDRNRNARKVRKAYSFSKLREVHELITYEPVQLQLLLAGADATRQGGPEAVSATDAGYGRGTNGPHLEDPGVGHLSSH